MFSLAAINWDVSPEIFSFGFVKIRWYGLLFVLGFIVGYEILRKIFLNEGKTLKQLDSLIITMLISTVIGARLGHCLFYNPAYYFEDPIRFLQIWQGGLASHGGAFGILIGLWIFTKRHAPHITMPWILDRIVIAIPLAGTLIRIGNFINSEIIGTPSDLPWAVVFQRIDMIPRHPAQLYEAACYFCIFLFLFFRYKTKKGKLIQWETFGLFLTMLFSARFIIEFVKRVQVDYEATWLLDTGQLLSLPFIIAGIVFLYLSRKQVPKAK